MKKLQIIALVVLASMAIIGCATNQSAGKDAPVPQITQLGLGEMFVYDFGTIKLHAYNSKDLIADQAFLLESKNELTLIELIPFYANIEEFSKYIQGLGKPLNSVIVAYHPAGGDVYPNAKMYASEGLGEAALVPYFAESFGNIFNANLPKAYELVKPGLMTVGGIRFNVIQTAHAFDLEIPEINVYLAHMVGSNTHNILTSIDDIDGMIAQMKGFQSKKYRLILTGHDIPRTIDVAAEKIAYLEKTKELAKSSNNAGAFIQAMKNAFPNYYGENYLEMSAGALFGS